MITEDSVREVIDTARIEDVVGDFVNLKRRGNNYSGLCPFHNEKTPSFNVNPARNIYKCFGCGVGGDPVNFLMELEQLTFPEAIRWIAGKYNLQLEEKEVSQEVRQEMQERESLLITNDYARSYFAGQLYETDEGKSIGLGYFKQRGYRKETIETFGLGYAPARGDGLRKSALAAGHKEARLEQLGLVRNGRDFFYDRVMFTIHNLGGKPIAFAGRVLKKDAKAPKYINSPETEIYHKSDVLYGMYQARQSVRKLDNVYMVEGYTDVISLHQNGIENVVATSGTSLTAGQARLVKRFTENVTLLYDGDKAGVKAALRGVDVLLEADLNVKVVILPDGHDPDSYLQSVGSTQFDNYLQAERKDFLFFKADLLLEEAGQDVARRTAVIRDIGSTLALVSDPLKRAGYLQQFSGRLGIEETLLVNLVNKAITERRKKSSKEREREDRQSAASPGPEAPREPVSKAKPSELGHTWQEKFLVQLLIRHGHREYDDETGVTVAEYLTANVADLLQDFDAARYRDVVVEVMGYLRSKDRPPAEDWYTKHKDAFLRDLALESLISPYTYSPRWEETYGVQLSQKMPEDNHRLSVETFLPIFRIMKIARKLTENRKLIEKYESAGDFTRVRVHLDVHMKLDRLYRDLAARVGNVVMSL